MQMLFLPNTKVIIQDDGPRTVMATLGALPVKAVNLNALAKAMAVAPAMLCLLDNFAYVQADDEGNRTFSAEEMKPVHDILAAFSEVDVVNLTHYVHMIK